MLVIQGTTRLCFFGTATTMCVTNHEEKKTVEKYFVEDAEG